MTEVTPLTSRIVAQQASSLKPCEGTSIRMDAGGENSERPTRSETDLRPPKWLTRIVEALVPPELGSPNELIDVLLETHGSIPQAVLLIPVAIAPPALGRARDRFYWKMAKHCSPTLLQATVKQSLTWAVPAGFSILIYKR